MPKRINTLVWGKDKVGDFLWKTMSRTFRYAANRIPEIANTIVEVDDAIKWGFGWEIGVFESWDAVGPEEKKVDAKIVQKAIKELEIDTEKRDPAIS